MNQGKANSGLIDALWVLDAVGRKPEDFRAPHDMRERIEGLLQLPPLPEMARRILALQNDPHGDARKLAQIVEMDPSLAAQVIRWSNSARYGCRTRMPSITESIALVLGYHQVLNLAFALCALKPFRVPTEGPLGKRFFWRQTLAGSALMQKLAQAMGDAARPEPGTIHLLYLLHNIGHPLLAHLFPEEFDYLGRAVSANLGTQLVRLERFLLDVDHGQLGAWLMRGWNLPECLQIVTQHHHNPYYRGAHEQLVWLTCLTDGLLGRIGIGDACHVSLEESPLFGNLGIGQDLAEACLDELKRSLADLEQAVASLLS